MTMTTTTWVLGASDPEMEAIERLLREYGQAVAYATLGDQRVAPRDAYRADATSWPAGPLVLVECGAADPSREGDVVARCDHHNPGDLGWGGPPDKFWVASSLGQAVNLLAAEGVLFPSWWRVDIDPAAVAWTQATRDGLTRVGYDPASRHWVIGQQAEWFMVPAAMAQIAAADHCLGAAYAGKCPGVDSGELFEARSAARGAWLARGPGEGRDGARAEIARAYGQSPADLDEEWPGAEGGWTSAVRHATEQTRLRLRSGEFPVADLGSLPVGCDYHGPGHADPVSCRECGLSPEVSVLDLRAVGTLPELPTALGLEGLCALYRMPPPPGKPGPAKVGIIGAGMGTAPGPEPVEAFLSAAREGCVAGTRVVPGPPGAPGAPYGDPARGYAGAYERGAP